MEEMTQIMNQVLQAFGSQFAKQGEDSFWQRAYAASLAGRRAVNDGATSAGEIAVLATEDADAALNAFHEHQGATVIREGDSAIVLRGAGSALKGSSIELVLHTPDDNEYMSYREQALSALFVLMIEESPELVALIGRKVEAMKAEQEAMS